MNAADRSILDSALHLVIGRRQWFTAEDIATACDVDIPLEHVKAWLISGLPALDLVRYSAPDNSHIDFFTTDDFLARWWIERASRWVESNLETLSDHELGCSMAITFGVGTWNAPPSTLLEAGISLHAIAQTIDEHRFAMPWSIIANHLPHISQYLRSILRVANVRQAVDPTTTEGRWDELFSEIDWRGIEVLKLRFGLEGAEIRTLEDIGEELDLTRERIRQIERMSLHRLKRSGRLALPGLAAATLFAKRSKPLVMQEHDIPPELLLVRSVFGEKLNGTIQQLGILMLHRSQWVRDFEVALNSADNENHIFEERVGGGASMSIPPKIREMLATIPLAEANYLSAAALKFLNDRFDSMPRKERVYRALNHLGTASHYSEVAEICNKVWPARPLSGQHTINNLSACEKDPNYDVVWIGRKGMYGLESLGYSRPDMDLFKTVAEIVKSEYETTRAPVTLDTVWHLIHRYRQEPHKPSVQMAVSFNDKVAPLGNGTYVPADSDIAPTPDEGARSGFDFSGTF